MTFESLGIVEIPKQMQEDWYDYDNYWEVEEQIDKLKDSSEIVQITLKDGSQLWATKANMNGGQCDCCGKFNRSHVTKVQGFRILP